MTPQLFGPPGRRLLGFYHPPEKSGAVRQAALLCAPFGNEATRSHRLYRVVAQRLARAGVAVLRFDYHGTGDAPGDGSEGELDGWRRDLLCAHDELLRLAAPETVGWIGARLGATLALQAAHGARHLSQLMLWDPVVDGPSYLRELRVAHMDILKLSFYALDKRWYRARPERDTQPLTEAIGFAVSPALYAQLEALRPDMLKAPAQATTRVLAASDDAPVIRWCSAQQAAHAPVALEALEHPLEWTSDPLANSAIVPGEATQRLVSIFHAKRT